MNHLIPEKRTPFRLKRIAIVKFIIKAKKSGKELSEEKEEMKDLE